MLEKCGKNEGGNYFFYTLVFDTKTRSQFRPACTKIREKYLKTKSEGPPTLCMEMWTFPFEEEKAFYRKSCREIL